MSDRVKGWEQVTDFSGNPLSEGDHVEAWRDGVRYTATVKEIRPHRHGDGNFRRVTLVRDDSGAEVKNYSDSVVKLAAAQAQKEKL